VRKNKGRGSDNKVPIVVKKLPTNEC